MRMSCSAVLLLWVLGMAPLLAASYQYQALIDLDGDGSSGCLVESGEVGVAGSELRALARSDRVSVVEVAIQSCRDGSWHDEFRSTEPVAIGHGQGDAGSDRIAWSLPLNQFSAWPRLSMRLMAERLDLAASDAVGDGTQAAIVALDLGQAARPIPLLGGLGLLLMALMLGWLGRRHLHRAGAAVPLGIGWLALLALTLAPPMAPVHADSARSVVAWDVGNDSADAGSDILRAEVAVVGGNLAFQFDVNNIEDNGLPDHAKVLFIGNSLTYSHDMPMMLEAIVAQTGKVLVADAITAPNAALEDHFRQRTAHTALANGGYRWVIMQQGPSSLPESQAHLRTWASRFDPLIRAGGARPALYMVWPDASRSAFFDDVRDSYSEAALAINGMFIPAGEAWREAWRAVPTLPLYDSDQFHPSVLGSYAAALSIYAELYQQSPSGLPAQLRLRNGALLHFDPDQLRSVQAAVWRTHLSLGRRGG